MNPEYKQVRTKKGVTVSQHLVSRVWLSQFNVTIAFGTDQTEAEDKADAAYEEFKAFAIEFEKKYNQPRPAHD